MFQIKIAPNWIKILESILIFLEQYCHETNYNFVAHEMTPIFNHNVVLLNMICDAIWIKVHKVGKTQIERQPKMWKKTENFDFGFMLEINRAMPVEHNPKILDRMNKCYLGKWSYETCHVDFQKRCTKSAKTCY